MELKVYDSNGALKITGAGGGGGGITNINVSAGTTSNLLSRITFANSNGITWGLNASTLTASHNGLTTAMASNRGSDFVAATAAFAGTNASGTIASNGISVSVGNYITTAALSGDTSKYVQAWELTGNTAGTTSSLQGTKLYFEGGNSITVSGNSNTVKFSVGNYITTAMASNRGSDFVAATAAFAGTNASGTIASNGISVSVAAPGAAAESNHIHLLGANTAGNTTASGSTIGWSAGNGLTLSGTNGSQIVISVGPYLTTAMASNAGSNFAGLGETVTTTAGTDLKLTVDSNGVNIAHPLWLTTARGSTDAVGLNTAQTNVTWTVNSAGLSLNAAGYAGTGTSATNATLTLDSNGLAISVAAPGGGAGTTLSGYNPFLQASTAIQQHSNGTLMFWPVDLPAPVQYDRLGMLLYNTNSSNSSGSHTLSFWWGMYTQNGASLSLHHSGSGSTALTHSGTAGSYSLYSNIRIKTIAGPTTTMNPGNYWLGFVSRTTSGGANGSYSMACMSQVNSGVVGVFGAAATATAQPQLGIGVYSVSTSGIPGSVAFTEITGTAANYRRFPQIWFASSTQ